MTVNYSALIVVLLVVILLFVVLFGFDAIG